MRGREGFTLVELILVTVIIGILAGMVTLLFRGRSQQAMIKRVQADIRTFESALDTFEIENGKYPKSLNELVGGKQEYLKRIEPDPWGNPYNYRMPGKMNTTSYDLFSSGPDGQPGTADDVVNWKTFT